MPRLIRHRFLFGFAAAALILAAVGMSILSGVRQSINDSQWVAHTYQVLGTIEQINAALSEGVSAQRSYLLTGQTVYRDEFQSVRPRLRQDLVLLAGLLSGNAAQTERVASLSGLIEQRMEVATESVRLYERNGLEFARRHVRNNHGADLMRQIERTAAEMRRVEQSMLDLRVAKAERSALVLLGLGALGIPLSLVILGWIYLLLSREVRHRANAEQHASEVNTRLNQTVSLLQQASDDQSALSKFTGMLQSCRGVTEALMLVRQSLSTLLPDYGITIYLLRTSQDHLEAVLSWGPQHAHSANVMAIHDCWALRRGQVHYANDLHTHTSCPHIQVPLAGVSTATACIPLIAQGTSLGFVFISGAGPGPLERVSIAISAAEQLALALTNLQLQESLRVQSIRDPLTGLFNRRYLEESLPREMARCKRHDMPLALMMLDIDHFKQFNDNHGHDGGDALLASFGQLLQTHCRGEDIACRYGGEEFTLILPEMDLPTALQRADSIRQAVEIMAVQHLQQPMGSVTVSIGVAVYPGHASTGTELRRIADAALYRAKRNGRNRIESADAQAAAVDEPASSPIPQPPAAP